MIQCVVASKELGIEKKHVGSARWRHRVVVGFRQQTSAFGRRLTVGTRLVGLAPLDYLSDPCLSPLHALYTRETGHSHAS